MLLVLEPLRLQMMRVMAAVMLVLALLPLPAQAQDQPSLDELFAALKSAPDRNAAAGITSQIWQRWTHPDDPELAKRMDEVLRLRSAGHLTLVLEQLDAVVADYPDYAEGWNQRATVHYMMSNFEASLGDIEKTLALEPRHFGALSGRALIYIAQDKRALALKDMSRAVAINPYLVERQLFPELLEQVTRI